MVKLTQHIHQKFLCKRRYLNHIFDGPQGPFKTKDYRAIISAVSKTSLGLDVIYEFLSNNLNKTIKEVPDGESIITHMYSILASKITTDNEIEKVCTHMNTIYKNHICFIVRL